jgi:hypothetical protein
MMVSFIDWILTHSLIHSLNHSFTQSLIHCCHEYEVMIDLRSKTSISKCRMEVLEWNRDLTIFPFPESFENQRLFCHNIQHGQHTLPVYTDNCRTIKCVLLHSHWPYHILNFDSCKTLSRHLKTLTKL